MIEFNFPEEKPQYKKGWIPKNDKQALNFLRNADIDTLHEVGFGQWNEPDKEGNVLYLFPEKWFNHIPEGFLIGCIDEKKYFFNKEKIDDDTRFGLLAYGIYRNVKNNMLNLGLE